MVPRSLVASPAYLAQRGAPEKPEDLSGYKCLSYSQDAAIETWELSRGASRRSHRAEGSFSANNGDFLVRLVMNSEGIALLPRFIVEECSRTVSWRFYRAGLVQRSG